MCSNLSDACSSTLSRPDRVNALLIAGQAFGSFLTTNSHARPWSSTLKVALAAERGMRDKESSTPTVSAHRWSGELSRR